MIYVLVAALAISMGSLNASASDALKAIQESNFATFKEAFAQDAKQTTHLEGYFVLAHNVAHTRTNELLDPKPETRSWFTRMLAKAPRRLGIISVLNTVAMLTGAGATVPLLINAPQPCYRSDYSGTDYSSYVEKFMANAPEYGIYSSYIAKFMSAALASAGSAIICMLVNELIENSNPLHTAYIAQKRYADAWAIHSYLQAKRAQTLTIK